MVNGDLMFSVRYDTCFFFVFIIVNLGWVRGYRAKFLTLLPLVIVILPCRQTMKASAVASQTLPKIQGCPSRQFLGLIS